MVKETVLFCISPFMMMRLSMFSILHGLKWSLWLKRLFYLQTLQMTAHANVLVKAKNALASVSAIQSIVQTVKITVPVVTAEAAYPLVMNISGEVKNKFLLHA